MSDGMGSKIDEIYERITGASGVPEAAGTFFKIPNSGNLKDLAIAMGKDLSKITASSFMVRILTLSTGGYAGSACPSNSFSSNTHVSVSYNTSTTAYSVAGVSVYASGDDAHCSASIEFELYVKF